MEQSKVGQDGAGRVRKGRAGWAGGVEQGGAGWGRVGQGGFGPSVEQFKILLGRESR